MEKINYPDPSIQIPEQVNIEGKKVNLLSYHESHDKAVQKFSSDIETMKYLKFMAKQPQGWTLEEARNRRLSRMESQRAGLMVNFSIAVKKSTLEKFNITTFADDEFLDPRTVYTDPKTGCPEFDIGNEPYVIGGVTGLHHIDLSSARAEIGIVVDHRIWGNGFSTEALLKVMQYSFEALKLHRVEFCTTKDNTAMRGWLEKVGKKQPESIWKDYIFTEGAYNDSYNYAFFEVDWHTYLSKRLQ